jgi:hypothetical protein
MKIDGACHCGKITYEAEVNPGGARICHCTDCQTMGGSAFRMVVPSVVDGFRVTSGTPKIYVKIAESGNPRAQAFCPDCGTHIYASPSGEGPKVYNIRTSSVRQRDQIVPQFQGWHRSARPWLSQLATIPRVETQ